MPLLKKMEAIEVVLPNSGIVCKLYANYADAVEIQRVLLGEMKYDMSGKGDNNIITGETLSKQTTYAMSRVVKEWDAQDEQGEILPINWETIGMLDPEDGRFLSGKVDEIINPKQSNAEKKD